MAGNTGPTQNRGFAATGRLGRPLAMEETQLTIQFSQRRKGLQNATLGATVPISVGVGVKFATEPGGFDIQRSIS